MTEPARGSQSAQDSHSVSPAEVHAAAARRQAEANMSPEQRAEQLEQAIDELLAQDVQGLEEAALLEQAQTLVNDALGRGN